MTLALTHALQEGHLVQHLISLVAPFCVDQWQSDGVGSLFLHQSPQLMSVHFEKKNRLKRPILLHTSVYHDSGCQNRSRRLETPESEVS